MAFQQEAKIIYFARLTLTHSAAALLRSVRAWKSLNIITEVQ